MGSWISTTEQLRRRFDERLFLVAFALPFLFIAINLSAHKASAATYTWNLNNGTWSTNSTNWITAPPATPWASGNTNVAAFTVSGDSAASISGTVFVGGIFSSIATTISGGTLDLAATTNPITANAATTISAPIVGSSGLLLNGNNTLTLTGSNSYTGTTTINGGTLQVGTVNSLPQTTAAFTNTSGTVGLNLQGIAQTLGNLTFGVSGTSNVFINGIAGSSLTVSPAALTFSPSNSLYTLNVNMSGLPSFSYSNATGTFAVNLGGATTNGGASTVTLASSNAITAATVTIGNSNDSGGNITSTLNLGNTNSIFADNVNLGDSNARGTGVIQFASGLSGPETLKIRAHDGVSAANIIIGQNASSGGDSNVYGGTFNTSAGTLDALVGTMTLGNALALTASGRECFSTGTFTMGAGTLTATTANLGNVSNTSFASQTLNGTGNLNITGGLAIISTLNMGTDSALSGQTSVTLNATVNVNANATLDATTIQLGSITSGQTVNRTTTVNLNGGTLGNISSGSLTVTGVPIALIGTGDALNISLGQTGSIASVVSGTGNLANVGPGITFLTGTNTYSGGTTIKAGTFSVGTIADSVFSNMGYSGVTTLAGGELQYTGSVTASTTRSFSLSANSTFQPTSATGGLTINNAFTSTSANNLLTMTGPGTLTLAGNVDDSNLGVQVLGGLLVLGHTTTSSTVGGHAIGTPNTTGLTITAGTVQLAGSGTGQFYYETNVLVNGGVFDFNGRSDDFNVLSGTGGIITNNASSTTSVMTVGDYTGNGTYSGSIQDGAGSIGLTKTGSGSMALGGMNSYSGVTTASGGTLQFLGSSVTALTSTGANVLLTGSSTVALASGASIVDAGTVKLGDAAASPGSFVQSGGSMFVNGVDTAANGNRALTIGEFLGETSTYTLSTGVLSVPNGITYVPWDGAGILNISGGSANLMQVQFGSIATDPNTPTGGTLNLSGGALYIGSGGIVNLAGKGPAVINLTGGTLGAYATWSSSVPMSLSNSIIIDTAGNGITLSGALTGAGSLTTINPGTLTLSASNSYTGVTTINGGAILLSGTGSINSSSAINVNAGGKFVQNSSVAVSPSVLIAQGTLDGTGTVNTATLTDSINSTVQNGNGGAGTLTLGALTLNGAATVNLFQSGGTVTSIPSLNILGALTTGTINGASGIVTLDIQSLSGWSNSATYDVMNFGSLANVGSAAFTANIIGVSGRQNATLTYTSNSLLLTIAGDSPKWTGLDSASWQVGSTGPNSNWKLVIAGTATNYIEGDLVLFDDTAGTAGSVVISNGNVSPNLTTFNNNTLNYSLTSPSGYGIAGSGSLVKSGTGIVAISTANSYSGGTTLTAGVLQVGSNSALGSGAVSLSGGTLSSTGTIGYTLANPLAISGNVTVGDPINNGPLTITGTSGVLTNNPVLTINSPVSFSNSFSGTASLTVAGTGTLALNAASNYTGGTTLGSNLVQIGANTAFGTGPLFLTGGALTSTGTTGYTLSNPISITGSVTLGDPTNNGALAFSAAAGTLNGSTALTVNSPVLIGSSLGGGAAGLTKLGPGLLTLSGTNTFTGGINLLAGTLAISSNYNLGSTVSALDATTINGGQLALTSANITPVSTQALIFNGSGGTLIGSQSNGNDLVIGSNMLYGSGVITVTGSTSTDSVMQVSGAQPSLTSPINIVSGRINVSSSATTLGIGNIAVGAGSASLYLSAPATLSNNISIQSNGGENRGAVRLQNGGTLNGSLTLLGNAAIADESSTSPAIVNGNISGAFTFDVGGLTNSNSAAQYILTGSNSQAATTIGSGILNINADQALGITSGTLIFGNNGSALQAGAGGIILSASRSVILNNSGTFDTNGFNMTVAGSISGAGSLNKINAGTLTLANNESYAGSTTINAGTLTIGVNTALPTATTVNFSGNATLNVGSFTQSITGLTVANSVTGTVTGGGSLMVSGTGDFRVGGTSGALTQTLNMSTLGSFSYNGSPYTFDAGGQYTGTASTSTAAGTIYLAAHNSITANLFGLASANNDAQLDNETSTGTIYLGQTNTINAGTWEVGFTNLRSAAIGTLEFAPGSVSPSLNIYGTSGSNSRIGIIYLGAITSSSYPNNSTGTIDLLTGVTGGSTLYALVNQLLIGDHSYTSGNNSEAIGVFNMGGGTLDVTTMIVGDQPGVSASGTGSGVGTFSLNGGTVLASTITLGNRATSSTATASGTFNLNSGLVSATAIQGGSLAATRVFNWSSGTIATYNQAYGLTGGISQNSISVTIPAIAMSTAGIHDFFIANGQTGSVTSIVSGNSSALTSNGGGLLNLSASNSYGGGTVVSAGTLQLGNANALGTGGLTANAGVVDLNGQSPVSVASLSGLNGLITDNSANSSNTFTVNQNINTTFNGSIQDGPTVSLGLTKSGTGALTLSASSGYSGPTTINTGSLVAGGNFTLSPSSAFTLNGGTLDVTQGSQSIAGLTINSGTLNLNLGNLLTINGSAILGDTLNLPNLSTYSLSGNSIELMSYTSDSGAFNNAASFTGYNLVDTGTQLDLYKIASSGAASWNSSTGGSWNTPGNWTPVGNPSAVGAMVTMGSALLSAGTVTLDSAQTVGLLTFNNSASYTITPGTTGNGSLTLSNTGGNPGMITVLMGTHSIAAPLTLAGTSSLITLSGGGSLDISGNVLDGSGSSSLTLSGDGTGVLSLDGSNTFAGGAYVNNGTLILNGAASLLAGSSLTIGSGSGPGAVFAQPLAISPSPAALAPVPEPGTLTMLAVCGIVIGIIMRRRKR